MRYVDFITLLLSLPQECKEIIDNEVFQFHLPHKHHDCPYCGASHTVIDKYRVQKLRGIHFMELSVHYRNRRYKCTNCGRTFSENRSFIQRYQRMPQSVVENIVADHSELITTSSIARRYGVSPNTIARHFAKYVQEKEKATEFLEQDISASKPRVLSMDEFRGNVGAKFQVAIHELAQRTCFAIFPDRGKEKIESSILSLPVSVRENVETFIIDLSAQFRSLVTEYFPNAVIGADKFHAQRLANDALNTVRKAEQAKIKEAEARAHFKKSRKLLLSSPENLDEEAKNKLNNLLSFSSEIRKAYDLKEAYRALFEHNTRSDFMEGVMAFEHQVKESGLTAFRSVARTTIEWKEEIWHGIETGYNNGFTEGCNNTIKVLKRIAYGFRNFENFKRRILFILNNPKRMARRTVKPCRII